MGRPRRSPARCLSCQATMRFSYEPATTGTVLAGAHGLCNTCYLRKQRSGTIPAVPTPAPVQAHHGDIIQLVRWTNTRDGWTHELVGGVYAGRDRDTLTLLVGSDVRVFDRTEWEVCVA